MVLENANRFANVSLETYCYILTSSYHGIILSYHGIVFRSISWFKMTGSDFLKNFLHVDEIIHQEIVNKNLDNHINVTHSGSMLHFYTP